MQRLFQVYLTLFGVIVIGIALAHLAIGPAAVIAGSPVNPSTDGEDRFFAGIFLCVGVAFLWCARDVAHHRGYLNLLAAAFLVGAVGRLLSVLLAGVPHPFYLAMLAVEVTAPVLVIFGAGHVAKTPAVEQVSTADQAR